jgi:nucleoside-triphosphatase
VVLNDDMSDVKKNIFLTGAPSSGKTTVIRKVIAGLHLPANGFYTEEERVEGKRVGFVMTTLDGRRGYLAHQGIRSDFRVRRYGVIILDEIGKMECFSEVFRKAAITALDSPSIVVGTITFGGDDFILGIKKRPDIEISEVTPENRDTLPALILQRVAELMNHAGDSAL